MSQPSLGEDKEDGCNATDKHDSPPMSPMCSTNGKKAHTQKSPTGLINTHWEESDEKLNQNRYRIFLIHNFYTELFKIVNSEFFAFQLFPFSLISTETEEQEGDLEGTVDNHWISGKSNYLDGDDAVRKSSLHEKVRRLWS